MCNHLNKNKQTKENGSSGPQTKDTVEQKKTQEGAIYCYYFTWCLVMRTQVPHNQTPALLKIPGKEVQKSQRRLWTKWVKGAKLQFWVVKVGSCRLPSPNILAMSQAAFGVFPLHGGPFVTIESGWTPWHCL